MLTAERRQAILGRLERDGKVIASELVETLGVSEDTVRRDLRELAAGGLVQRVHGGALPPPPGVGPFTQRLRVAPERDCTVLTNSPPVAAALAAHPRAEVVLIGGRLLKASQVTVGSATVDALRQVHADACVLGICSIHPELGVTAIDHDEAHVKRAMVAASAEVIALATADKLRTAGPWVVAPLADLTHLVTDAGDDLTSAYAAA